MTPGTAVTTGVTTTSNQGNLRSSPRPTSSAGRRTRSDSTRTTVAVPLAPTISTRAEIPTHGINSPLCGQGRSSYTNLRSTSPNDVGSEPLYTAPASPGTAVISPHRKRSSGGSTGSRASGPDRPTKRTVHSPAHEQLAPWDVKPARYAVTQRQDRLGLVSDRPRSGREPCFATTPSSITNEQSGASNTTSKPSRSGRSKMRLKPSTCGPT